MLITRVTHDRAITFAIGRLEITTYSCKQFINAAVKPAGRARAVCTRRMRAHFAHNRYAKSFVLYARTRLLTRLGESDADGISRDFTCKCEKRACAVAMPSARNAGKLTYASYFLTCAEIRATCNDRAAGRIATPTRVRDSVGVPARAHVTISPPRAFDSAFTIHLLARTSRFLEAFYY